LGCAPFLVPCGAPCAFRALIAKAQAIDHVVGRAAGDCFEVPMANLIRSDRPVQLRHVRHQEIRVDRMGLGLEQSLDLELGHTWDPSDQAAPFFDSAARRDDESKARWRIDDAPDDRILPQLGELLFASPRIVVGGGPLRFGVRCGEAQLARRGEDLHRSDVLTHGLNRIDLQQGIATARVADGGQHEVKPLRSNIISF